MPLQLPLFPLNTVLFPGMTLPLHIFEPRYREMTNHCLHAHQPFGVVLIKSGAETGAPAETGGIGTYGTISRVERLTDGRMNIEVVGQERFRILDLGHEHAYLTGTVEKFPLQAADEAAAGAAAQRLLPWMIRYLKTLGEAADLHLEAQTIPARPEALAYLGAILLQIPNPDKQALLTCSTTEAMLTRQNQLFRREISLLRAMLATPPAETNPDFNPN